MPINITDEINRIIHEVNNVISVNKIFIFGSYAYGEPSENSDLDFCIITNDTSIRKRELMRSIRKSISKVATMPIDILVYCKDEFSERSMLESTIEHKIASEGVRVYEQ